MGWFCKIQALGQTGDLIGNFEKKKTMSAEARVDTVEYAFF